jgi:integrase
VQPPTLGAVVIRSAGRLRLARISFSATSLLGAACARARRHSAGHSHLSGSCADHLGHSNVSMTQDRYMARGRVHAEVADLLDRTVAINDE